MAEPFLAELRIVSFNFPPKGWAFANGQFMQINQNQALFSLLGTTYGGDGRVTFALPDMRGRVPIYKGQGHTLGERGGEEGHTLTISEMPTHFHFGQGSNTAAEASIPSNTAYLGVQNNTYAAAGNLVAMAAGEIGNAGGSQAHNNMQPYLALNVIIALQGIFPSQT